MSVHLIHTEANPALLGKRGKENQHDGIDVPMENDLRKGCIKEKR